jgi:manganese transport protein
VSWLRNLVKETVGPTAVIAAGTMGGGAIASFLLAGAWFRYDLLWVLLLMLPIFVIGVDSSSRIGSLNRERGMLSLIRQHIHPGFAWALLAINIPVHVFVIMGQASVMTSSLISLTGFFPPEAGSPDGYAQNYRYVELALSLVCAIAILWLILSQGYDRMQKAMSGLMLAMFLCFLVVAIWGFSELGDIAQGFVPKVPDDLPIPGTSDYRLVSSSMIGMVGSAVAAGALLGMPYYTSDAGVEETDLRQNFRRSVLNLGLIFGAYAMFVVIAGGYSLFPLENNAHIDAVHEASGVFSRVFPENLAFLGPLIFSAGVFMAAMTTLIVAAQVLTYFSLDLLKKSWRFTPDNNLYHKVLAGFILIPAALAPFWSFPALLKVVILMGVNVIVIPLVFASIVYMVNSEKVVGEHRAEWWRNMILVAGLLLTIVLAAIKLPDYVDFFAG